MFRSVFVRIKTLWHRRHSPRMVRPFVGTDGRVLERTRVSTSTFIDHPQSLSLADDVYIGHHNYLEASHRLSIGEGCQITNFVTITTHSTHDSIRLCSGNHGAFREPTGVVCGPISIGRYSFIGPHSTIMPNTTIGQGSIVKAYSYVRGDFPDFAVISGNPAAVVGSTQDRDRTVLADHPELKAAYDAWAHGRERPS